MSKIQAETLISVIGRHIASAELNLIKDFPWLEKDLADRSAVDRLNLKKLLAAGITVADALAILQASVNKITLPIVKD